MSRPGRNARLRRYHPPSLRGSWGNVGAVLVGLADFSGPGGSRLGAGAGAGGGSVAEAVEPVCRYCGGVHRSAACIRRVCPACGRRGHLPRLCGGVR